MCLVVLALAWLSPTPALPSEDVDEQLQILTDGPPTKTLAVRVVDPDGQPVGGVVLTPWALRSSQGHGWWAETDDPSELSPQPSTTDADGRATILYPKYRDFKERTGTIGVSVRTQAVGFVDQADHHLNDLSGDEPVTVTVTPAGTAELVPSFGESPVGLDDPVGLDKIYAVAPYQAHCDRTGQAIRVGGLAPGLSSLMLVAVDGDRATHFSDPVGVTVEAGQTASRTVAMRPAVQIIGRLDDSVARPVTGGRVIVQTIPPPRGETAEWADWSTVDADGTFAIDVWPAGRPFQAIALTDHHVAAPGTLPIAFRRDLMRQESGAGRPQVFQPDPAAGVNQPIAITIAMQPLVAVTVRAEDQRGHPVADVDVYSNPNVYWWNWGSQIYAEWLPETVRSLRVAFGELEPRPRPHWTDDTLPQFFAQTDAKGQGVLWLPPARGDLTVHDVDYEMPVFLGRRGVEVDLTDGQPKSLTLSLQPTGTEQLGEWDKLAGVVFGCSTREGQRICALPEVREKMDEFARRFREAGGQRDPELLAEAYHTVADAFEAAADPAESARWRVKAQQQEASLANPPTRD